MDIILLIGALAIYLVGVLIIARCMAGPSVVEWHQRNGTIPHQMERRTMPWAAQRVDMVLDSINAPGLTHDEATQKLVEIGVSHDRIRALLAGQRRGAIVQRGAA